MQGAWSKRCILSMCHSKHVKVPVIFLESFAIPQEEMMTHYQIPVATDYNNLMLKESALDSSPF